MTEIADNGYGIVRRCAGHSCSDRNLCRAHTEPIAEDQMVIWEPWERDRVNNRCPHFVPEAS